MSLMINDTSTALLLTYIADTYRATYPHELARIARAVALVEAGNVTLLPDGTAMVHSQKKQAMYHVNGECECPDQSAKDGNCKHRFAKTFAKHLIRLQLLARYAMYLDAATGEQVPGIAWPSLDMERILYAPDEDTYSMRMWTCFARQLVLLAYI
jgi:hypothetical protein